MARGLWVVLIFIVGLGLGCAAPQVAALPLASSPQITPPHVLLGTATWEPPIGTEVVAMQGGERLGAYRVEAGGRFSLQVLRPPVDGPITFEIGGVEAGQILLDWESGKIQSNFNLTAPVPADNNAGLAGVDTNGNGFIDLEEVFAVVDAYFEGERVGMPAPPPVPMPTPTGTPTPMPTAAPEPTAEPDPLEGLTIAPENRCSDYDPDDYRYPQSVEADIVAAMGGIIYSPYTGEYFDSTTETDIEHIIARSEAHDSGLCDDADATKTAFARDLLNLTLASPSLNRHQKGARDAAEWLPGLNQCWFADRIVQVRVKYGLTVDQAEVDAIKGVLDGCDSVEMVIVEPDAEPTLTPTAQPTAMPAIDALAMYDDNGDGRITCAEARRHGIAPVHRGHPAYPYMNDRDGDGVVCE